MARKKSATGRRARAAVAIPDKVTAQDSPATGFPIVGLGASAGGLEAFVQFFRNAAPDGGAAFVLVPHLDPSHASILAEILQRNTAMPVIEAMDDVPVKRDHVYVIPPNRDMAIFHGVLQLSVPEVPRGHRMPIDAFLRSLAEDQGENAVAIILSGTGTDGTLGLRAIRGAGGITMVQEPSTAKYDGMPSSAIKAGYATHVLAADAMPKALQAVLRKLSFRPGSSSSPVPAALLPVRGGMNAILAQLRSSTGHDFSQYKKSTIGRRIERRMSQHDIEDADVYSRYLKEHLAEAKALFRELLINVTSFFRDPEAFDTLRGEILPRLLGDKPEGYVLRAWVPGCASGEEAYSLAMVLRELMDEGGREFKVQIYATDLDDDAIADARSGAYPTNIAQDVTPERLRRFFIKSDAGYRVKKEIREMVVFAVQNVIKDPPFTRLDLLSCRNLLIYLEPELQDRLLSAFHYALCAGGVLVLSPSETIGAHTELFTPLSRKWKIYGAVASSASAHAVLAGGLSWAAGRVANAPDATVKKAKSTSLADLANRALLQAYAPASVVTDPTGNILFVHGETGKYLRPAPGQSAFNVVEMAREGLQAELRAALHHAAVDEKRAAERELTMKVGDDLQGVIVSVRQLSSPEAEGGLLLVSFRDWAGATPARPARGRRAEGSHSARRIAELESELAFTRENLQATIEEQQASNEELKSTNEEMQSTNEELQSTNEELETSREELQSVNEELVTVNSELQSKIEQLAEIQSDMKNLLDNISIGTIFLDGRLHVRRFTRDATRLFRLVASDVGRPLADIKSDLADVDLLAAARTVHETLVPWEREVRSANEEWFLAHVQPYRTVDNIIDGVVLTFTDISRRVAAEAAVRETQAMTLARSIAETVHEPMIVLDGSLRVISANPLFFRMFEIAQTDALGRKFHEMGSGQWNVPALRSALEQVLPQEQRLVDFVLEGEFPGLGSRKIVLNARRIPGKDGVQDLILLAMEPVRP